MAEAFVRTIKRDYVRVSPRPNAECCGFLATTHMQLSVGEVDGPIAIILRSHAPCEAAGKARESLQPKLRVAPLPQNGLRAA
jgi:hypothetical protein